MLAFTFPSPPRAGRKYKPVDSPLSKLMTNADVKYLMLDMAEDSPFLIRIREQYFQSAQRLSIAQRLLYAMKDAAFCYNLVSTYYYAGQELPRHWGRPDLHRAYQCLRNEVETKRTDPACHEALALGHP